MSFAVEMLLPQPLPGGRVNHSVVNQSIITNTRLRYEVVIKKDISDLDEGGFIWHPVLSEKLSTIPTSKDTWAKNYISDEALADYGLPQNESITYISNRYGQKNSDNFEEKTFNFGSVRELIQTAALGDADKINEAHVTAVRDEIISLNLLNLEDPANFSNYGLRHPSTDPKQTLNILTRIKKRNPENFQFLSSQLNQIVSGLGKIDIYTDELNRSTLTVTDHQGRRFPFESLSEGTLRIIALATRLVESDMRHILLLEEPENGIDPLRLENLVELLVRLSAYPDTEGKDLRQIICTTHSPVLLRALLKEEKAEVIFCSQPTYLFNDENGTRQSLRVSRMTPLRLDARFNETAERMEKFTLLQAMNYFKELAIDVSEFETLTHA